MWNLDGLFVTFTCWMDKIILATKLISDTTTWEGIPFITEQMLTDLHTCEAI
jgi:hypothetical protein